MTLSHVLCRFIALIHPECARLLLHGTTTHCASSSLSRIIWDPFSSSVGSGVGLEEMLAQCYPAVCSLVHLGTAQPAPP